MITSLASNIVFALFAMAFKVLTTISYIFMGLCQVILKWVTGPTFINMPYTHGGIVDIGWPIVRDFANLGFALALVWIGLATALRLAEYEAKKALPRLILMVLLVNFTPVICGLVVDASNIIMNFFLGATGDFGEILNFGTSQYSSLVDWLVSFATKPIALESITRSIAIYLFNMLAGWFFLLYAALFYVRYVAIWCLVIISPLAFFSYIFAKRTGGYFSQWWHQFIQWCFVGVPASFFLYLSWQILDKAETIIIPPPATDFAVYVGTSDIIGTMLIYSVVLVFLFIGFLASLSSGAIGATAIISTGKKLGAAAAIATHRKVGQWTGSSKFGKKVLEGASNFSVGQTLGKIPAFARAGEKLERSKWGRIVKGAGRTLAAPVDLVVRKTGQKGMGFIATSTGDIDKLMESTELKNLVKAEAWNTLASKYSNPLTTPWTKIAIATLISKYKGEVGFENMKKISGIADIDKQAARLASTYSPAHLKELLANAPTLAADPEVSKYTVKPRKWGVVQSDKLDAERIMRNDGIAGSFQDLLSWKRLGHPNRGYYDIVANKLAEENIDWRDMQKIGENLIREGIIAAGTDIFGAIKAGASNTDYQQITKEFALTRATRGLKVDAIPDLSRRTIDDEAFQRVFMKHRASGPYMRQFADSHGSQYVNDYNDVATKQVGALELAINNPQWLNQGVAGIYQDVCDKQITVDPKGNTTYTDPTTGRIITKTGAQMFSHTDRITGTTSFSLGTPLTPDYKPLMINTKDQAKGYITYINKFLKWKKAGSIGSEPERPKFMGP